MKFEGFGEVMGMGLKNMKQDENLGIADFEKIQNNVLNHICFEALDEFRRTEGRMPGKLIHLTDVRNLGCGGWA